MKKRSGKIRWEKVSRARANIASGLWVSRVYFKSVLSNRPVDDILYDLDACAVGDGHHYRDLVAESLSSILSNLVDTPLSQAEIPAAGGRADIELPLRIEALHGSALWNIWAQRYSIRSVLIETKNQANPASVEDVSQLSRYLTSTKRGGFGILLARNGFTKNALVNLSEMAKDGQQLILPLSHDQLRQLERARSIDECDQYMRRQETLLLQYV